MVFYNFILKLIYLLNQIFWLLNSEWNFRLIIDLIIGFLYV